MLVSNIDLKLGNSILNALNKFPFSAVVMKPLAREFRATVQVQGIHQQEDYFRSYNWKETLHEALASSDEESSSSLVLDVKAFDNPTLSDYLTVMNPGIKVEVRFNIYVINVLV